MKTDYKHLQETAQDSSGGPPDSAVSVAAVVDGDSKPPAATNASEPDKQQACVVIDVKVLDGEKVCRICHLSSDCPSESSSSSDLVLLGCGCKDELGTAHRHCAEAWFKLKGNRYCEICGEAAKNITGVGANRFMEEWNENSDGNSNARRGFLRGKPLCNFLMAFLVIAFVLPWFFRLNMF